MDFDFFECLYSDAEFLAAIGRVTLAAGRFESDLRHYLLLRGISVNEQAGLGTLVGILEKHRMISENGIQVLREVKRQRNYLTHSLFDLWSDRIAETMLPREDVIPSDTATYTEKAWVAEQNIQGLIRIVEDEIDALAAGNEPLSDRMLFRP